MMQQAPAPAEWYYASEMESIKHTVEQHSHDFTFVQSTISGLTRKITDRMNGLMQRL